MEEKDFESQKDLEKAHFQQELNRWFESKGIISDLRSHLRHLMITALQNTEIGLKPTDKTSPKTQALNLIVAEYLFRHGCHYTLSVFTSEVPTLANFSAINPSLIVYGQKYSETFKKSPQEHCFQEREFEEIFNALGMTSSFEETELLKTMYFQKGYDSSLVELLLQIFTDRLTKFQVRKTLERYEVDEGRKFLSEKWSAKVVDTLLSESIKPTQIEVIKQAISRITENEIKRLTEEEHKIQLQMLAEREKRIQEYLRQHEQEIFSRLMKAEKDLNERKDMIDEELTDRQKHLTKMAFEWNEKHEEIVKLSKNIHSIKNENIRLKKKIEKLERENQTFKTESETQKQTIEQLRTKISSLMSRLRKVTDLSFILPERTEVPMKSENNYVSVGRNIEEENNTAESEGKNPLRCSEKFISDNENAYGNIGNSELNQGLQNAIQVQVNLKPQECNTSQPVKSHLGSGDAIENPNSDELEDDNDSSNSFCCDEIISTARKKLQALEEESNRINKTYLDYKLKSQIGDLDISVNSLDKSQEEIVSPKVYAKVIKESRSCQTTSSDVDLKKFLKLQTQGGKKELSDDYTVKFIDKSPDTSFKKSEIRTPTKRQQQNREFFLKSRQLLVEFEKQNMEELNSGIPSVVDSSFQNFTSSSSEDFANSENLKESAKRSSKAALLTPLRTSSFYSIEEQEIKKELAAKETGSRREPFNLMSTENKNYLALLEETRIKSPQESARKLLRQQILSLESDADDEKQSSKEDKNSKSPKSLASTPNSVFSGKMSVGRKSGSDGRW